MPDLEAVRLLVPCFRCCNQAPRVGGGRAPFGG